MIERLDHVAIVVADTEPALEFFRDQLGLRVLAVDEPQPPAPAVRLTYLETGSIPIQLVEPLDDSSAVSAWLAQHGEGLHHICFASEDVDAAIRHLVGDTPYEPGSGLGRFAAFVPGALRHGTRIEFTEARLKASDDHRAQSKQQSA